MRHQPLEPTCGICSGLAYPKMEPLFENELWHVRHVDPPYPVPGWLMLVSQRHVAGPAHFDDREAASFGPTLRHLERVLEQLTGALRIYTAALGESFPHFHCHMVPRYAVMPREAKAWSVFDLQRAALSGEVLADELDVQEVCDAYRNTLAAYPPPRP